MKKSDAGQRGGMSKLLILKEWLTVADAARRLAIVFGEDVTEADVLHLALDGRLRLSVRFVNPTAARLGEVIPWAETEWELNMQLGSSIDLRDRFAPGDPQSCPPNLAALLKDIPPHGFRVFWPRMLSLEIGDGQFLRLADVISDLQGVWDLPMIGGEQRYIERKYQELSGDPAVTLQGFDGAFVKSSVGGQIYQLQEDFIENPIHHGSQAALEQLKQHIVENNINGAAADALLNQRMKWRKKYLASQKRPANLPEDAVIVVRTEALREFEQSINGAPTGQDTPLKTTERNTMLAIILGMAMDAYSYNPTQNRNPATGENSGSIHAALERKGLKVDAGTIRKYLNEAAEMHENPNPRKT